MTAKEEKIREAWNEIGVNFPIGVCMETGYSEVQNENDISKILEYHNISKDEIEFEYLELAGLRYRPKSLQGIETNNSWIKIESEDDLPKERCSCWTISDREILMNTFNTFNDMEFTFDHNKVTHYQPIQKPQPPIY